MRKSYPLIASVAVVTGLGVLAPTPASSTWDPTAEGGDAPPTVSSHGHERMGFFDSRVGTTAQQTLTAHHTATGRKSA
ncbi:MAG: hypothetical protein ACRDO7_05690, partial [Nocardioidaceae bacterium]